jgi:hypothetical protein
VGGFLLCADELGISGLAPRGPPIRHLRNFNPAEAAARSGSTDDPTWLASPRPLVDVYARRGIVRGVFGINPLKKGTVPFFADVDGWRGMGRRDAGMWRRSE